MSIRVSEKYGVNPTMPVCFFCGESKNEIALLGKLKGDVEAPKNCVIDYEPCDKCKEGMDRGVTFMGAVDTPSQENQPPVQAKDNGDKYLTGAYCVLDENAPVCVEHGLKKGNITLCDPRVIEIFLKGKSK